MWDRGSEPSLERLAGYVREHPDYGADWTRAVCQPLLRADLSLAWAQEEGEAAQRQAGLVLERARRRFGDIATYNREDLSATWALLKWLQAGLNAAIYVDVNQ